MPGLGFYEIPTPIDPNEQKADAPGFIEVLGHSIALLLLVSFSVVRCIVSPYRFKRLSSMSPDADQEISSFISKNRSVPEFLDIAIATMFIATLLFLYFPLIFDELFWVDPNNVFALAYGISAPLLGAGVTLLFRLSAAYKATDRAAHWYTEAVSSLLESRRNDLDCLPHTLRKLCLNERGGYRVYAIFLLPFFWILAHIRGATSASRINSKVLVAVMTALNRWYARLGKNRLVCMMAILRGGRGLSSRITIFAPFSTTDRSRYLYGLLASPPQAPPALLQATGLFSSR